MRKQSAIFRIFAILLTSATSAGDFYCLGANATESVDTLPILIVDALQNSKDIQSATPLYTIDANRIANSGITDISEALRSLPGINLKDYGGAGGLKTISVRGLGGKHTGVIYDGLPLSDIQTGEIDLSRYSLNNLKSISLSSAGESDIFIPAIAVASGAMLNISTLSNDFNKGINLASKLTVGAYGVVNPNLNLSGNNGKNLNYSLSGDFFHARNDYTYKLVNGTISTKERRENSAINSARGEAGIIYQPALRSRICAKVYYYNNHHHLPGPVIYYANPSNQKLHNRNFFTQIDYRQGLTSDLTLRVLAKFDWATTHYTDVDQQYPNGKLDQFYIQKHYYASGSLLYTPVDLISFSYAADYDKGLLHSNLSNNIDPSRDALLQTLGAKIKLGYIDINARVLHSLYKDNSRINNESRTYHRFSPIVSFSAKPFAGESLFIRASYKNVMRMPTFSELYFHHYGTINLDPETSNQYNIGVTYSQDALKSSILQNLELTVDCYLNEVKNKILAIPFNMFLWRMTNLGKVRMYGTDLSINSSFSLSQLHTLEIGGAYSFLRAENRTSADRSDWKKQVAYTPLHSGSFTFSWLNPWVNLGAHGIGASSRYATSENLPDTELSGYFEIGFSLFRSFRIKKNEISLRADLINAFNTQYEIIRRYPMPGRRWQFSVEYKFSSRN